MIIKKNGNTKESSNNEQYLMDEIGLLKQENEVLKQTIKELELDLILQQKEMVECEQGTVVKGKNSGWASIKNYKK
tara:strand:+ start:281 stop:508 length:228 start_codon:yes stop_codon:yes gene_type:complete